MDENFQQWKPVYTKILIGSLIVFFGGLSAYFGYQTYSASQEQKLQSEWDQLQQKAGSSNRAALFDFLTRHPSSDAAKIAVIDLVAQAMKDRQFEGLKEVTAQVKHQGDWLSALFLMARGNLNAETESCEAAVLEWQKILDQPKWRSLHSEARFRQAVCYEKLGQTEEAKKRLQIMAGEPADSVYSRMAKKWLSQLGRQI